MRHRFALVIPLLLTGFTARAADAGFYDRLRGADLQLATVGDKLARANVGLCDRRQPATGIVLAALDSFAPASRDEARRAFGLVQPLAVEALISDSAAAAVGVRPNDAIATVNGQALAPGPLAPDATIARLARASATLAKLPVGQPLTLGLVRDGHALNVTVRSPAECFGRFELVVGGGDDASTSDDGTTVRISAHLLGRLSDEEGAVVVAHEFAHLVLRHEQRLDAAGVHGGLAGGLGRNVRYFRQVETQADILSVDLLANAGFAPDSAARFWRGPGRRMSFLTDRSHPAAADRAATTQAEADAIRADPARAQHPPILATRDGTLDGDWQSILVRAR
jgi:Zn-dependent protease with chaperone function